MDNFGDLYEQVYRRPCIVLKTDGVIRSALARLYIRKGQDAEGNWLLKPREVEDFLAKQFGIFMKGGEEHNGKYNPMPRNIVGMSSEELEEWKSKYPGGREFLNRMLSIQECREYKHRHLWASGFSRQAIYDLRKKVETDNLGDVNPYKPVKWFDAISIEKMGVTQDSSRELKRIYDQISIEVENGNPSPYDEFYYDDLVFLQYIHTHYPALSIYDKLVITDHMKFYESEDHSEVMRNIDKWLKRRPWESPDKLEDYTEAVKSETINPIEPFLKQQFVRDEDCMPYALPTQIIDYFLGNRINRYYPNRDIYVIGIDPFDGYEITGSYDLGAGGNLQYSWDVVDKFDRKENWEIIAEET